MTWFAGNVQIHLTLHKNIKFITISPLLLKERSAIRAAQCFEIHFG